MRKIFYTTLFILIIGLLVLIGQIQDREPTQGEFYDPIEEYTEEFLNNPNAKM